MTTLKRIIETGMLSQDSSGSIGQEMISFNEQLVAQEFADEINSGNISIKDALDYFFYHEQKSKKYEEVMLALVSLLKTKKAEDMVKSVSEGYFSSKGRYPFYNPKRDKAPAKVGLYSSSKGGNPGKRYFNPHLNRLFFSAKLVGQAVKKTEVMNFITDELLGIITETNRTYFDDTKEKAFIALGETRSRYSLERLTQYLMDIERCPFVGKSASALIALGHREAIDFLIDYSKNKEVYEPGEVYFALKDSNDPRVVQELINVVKNRSYELSYAIISLGKLRDKNAVLPLAECLVDPKVDIDIKERVASALGELNDERAIPYLFESFETLYSHPNSNPKRDYGYVGAICSIGGKEAVSRAINLFKKEHYITKYHAMVVLGEIGGDESVDVLFEYISKEYISKPGRQEGIFYCLDALAKIRTEKAIKALEDYENKTKSGMVKKMLSSSPYLIKRNPALKRFLKE